MLICIWLEQLLASGSLDASAGRRDVPAPDSCCYCVALGTLHPVLNVFPQFNILDSCHNFKCGKCGGQTPPAAELRSLPARRMYGVEINFFFFEIQEPPSK